MLRSASARLARPPHKAIHAWRSFSATTSTAIEVCLSDDRLLSTCTPSPQLSQLTVTRTTSPRQLPPSSKLRFGRTFVRHSIRALALFGPFSVSAVGSYAKDSVDRENRMGRTFHRPV